MPSTNGTGEGVIMDPFTGPYGAPLDNDQFGNASTGALSTGIGFGPTVITDGAPSFTPNCIPGITLPDGVTQASTAILSCIGGGSSAAVADGYSVTTPRGAQPLLAYGEGLTQPQANEMSLQEATGNVAPEAEIANGYLNYTGQTIPDGQSAFGVIAGPTPVGAGFGASFGTFGG